MIEGLLPLLDFGVTAFLAVGMLWILSKRMAEISERLGTIIGMLQTSSRELSNLISHLDDDGQ